MGQAKKPTEKTQETNSPLRSISKPKENEKRNSPKMETEKGKKAQGKRGWKQVARGKGRAQELVISAQTPLIGTKRGIKLEETEDQNERPHKRVCAMLSNDGDRFGDLSAVAAMQHRQEQ